MGDIADETEQTLEDFLYDLKDSVGKLIGIVEPLPGHINNLVSDIASLKLIQAAKEIPGTASDVADKTGEAVGSVGETAATGVGAVPAVATDVLDDIESVGGTTKRASSSLLRTKLKRRRG